MQNMSEFLTFDKFSSFVDCWAELLAGWSVLFWFLSKQSWEQWIGKYINLCVPKFSMIWIRFPPLHYWWLFYSLWLARPVVSGCAGCAMAHPDFIRSVNPMSTTGNRLCQPNYYWHPQISRLSDSPVFRICIVLKLVVASGEQAIKWIPKST